jgi:hypothetical protein
MRRELRAEYLLAKDGSMPWSTKAFVRTVREIEHHEVVNSGRYADMFEDKSGRQWTNTALKDLEMAAETYMIKVHLFS